MPKARQNLNILLVLVPPLSKNSGGVQMSTHKIASYLASVGQEVSVYSFSVSGHDEASGYKLISSRERGHYKNEVNLKHFKETIAEVGPGFIINQMPYDLEIGRACADFPDSKLLGCLRNTLYMVRNDLSGYIHRTVPAGAGQLLDNFLGRQLFSGLHYWSHSRQLRQILRIYDKFIMFGPPNLQELEYFLPRFDRSKIALIPNSIPAVAEAVGHKEKRILWLGRLEDQQKKAYLIPRIWERLHELLPDWHFDIVGGGPQEKKVRAEIRRRKLPRITLHGRQSPDEFYQRSAIYLMTSTYEGFPNTLIEAQSYGCVPVVFNSYGIAEWILRAESGGILVAPFDEAAFVGEVHAIACDEHRRIELAEQSLANARRFEIQSVGMEWMKLFRSMDVSGHSNQR